MPAVANSSKKQNAKPKSSSLKEKAREVELELSAIEDDESDSEDSGVDEEGMKKLMKALGDDGLDDFGQAQLQALIEGGDSDEEDENEEDGSENEGVEDDAEEEREENEGADVGVSDSDDDEEVEEEEVALDDVESVDEDAVPRQKIEIDNKVALERILDTIKLDPSISWTETLIVSYPQTMDIDVNDDLNRELAFYKQALHGATTARTFAARHKLPFTRPSDYFAEMVKTDAHMERIRQRLLDESAGIKRSEEKRKEREGKKFGKQVQMEKLKERERSKKEMEERLKDLKRKRKGALDNAQADDDAFDVAVEDAISGRPAKRGKGLDEKKLPRHARDEKFGFGGVGRRSKQNTRDSTDNFGGHGKRGGGAGGKGKGKSQRPGKSRRMAAKSRS